jgi:hypothetical protein
MASNNSTVDGMGFEEVNQASSTDMISGASIYAASGIDTPLLNATSISTSYISGTANAIIGTTMVAQNLYVDVATSGAAYHVTGKGALASVGVGSPTAYGASIQTGSGTLGAGSTLAVNFGTSFVGTPHVVCSYRDSVSSVGVVCGSNVGSAGFSAIGDTASIAFDWMAVGI